MCVGCESRIGAPDGGLRSGDRVVLVRGRGLWGRRVRAGSEGVVVATNDLGEAEVHFLDRVELIDPDCVSLVAPMCERRSA